MWDYIEHNKIEETVNDPVQDGARAAAERLAADQGPRLVGDVERALHEREAPDQYLDPVSLGGLIVSIATLAWTVYTDLKKRTEQPSPEVVTRTVRVKLDHATQIDVGQRDRIIEVTVEETLRAATANDR